MEIEKMTTREILDYIEAYNAIVKHRSNIYLQQSKISRTVALMIRELEKRLEKIKLPKPNQTLPKTFNKGLIV